MIPLESVGTILDAIKARVLEIIINMSTGVPNGDRAKDNGELVRALADIVRDVGRGIATADEARRILGIPA